MKSLKHSLLDVDPFKNKGIILNDSVCNNEFSLES